jgi:hypothetical protein
MQKLKWAVVGLLSLTSLVVPEKLCKARDDGDVKAKARL